MTSKVKDRISNTIIIHYFLLVGSNQGFKYGIHNLKQQLNYKKLPSRFMSVPSSSIYVELLTKFRNIGCRAYLKTILRSYRMIYATINKEKIVRTNVETLQIVVYSPEGLPKTTSTFTR